jgi:DNA polymerase III subunit delta'
MFDKLIGNARVKETLKRFLLRGRVPNALLFAGDAGIGKRQFALELARNFLCTDDEADEACGLCPVCLRVGEFNIPQVTDKNKSEFEKVFFGGHGDVALAVTYKNFILVDAIRDLEKEANYRPFEGSARFFIVDEAERMNDAASNALLKILEEPPPTSYIFLITSRAESLLPTIRSRCQTLRFAPVPVDEIERYLINERAFTHDEARLASRLSRGSIGRAVSMDIADVRGRRERMLGVLQGAIETGDRAALMRVADEMGDAKNKDRFEESLDMLGSLIHDVWSLRTAGDDTRLANADLADGLARLADKAGPADLPAWLADIETLRQNLVVNINRKVAAAALFAGMTAP